MDIFNCITSDFIWLPLLELLIAIVFIRAIINDIKVRIKPSNPRAEVNRGEKSWARLLAFWALAIVIIEIIISSESIAYHKVIIGLLNLAVLIYLNLFSGYFRNKIIGWWSKIQSMKEY